MISCPTLKIGEAGGERRSRWHNRPRCREPKKSPAGSVTSTCGTKK
jgi:hypothetical protein